MKQFYLISYFTLSSRKCKYFCEKNFMKKHIFFAKNGVLHPSTANMVPPNEKIPPIFPNFSRSSTHVARPRVQNIIYAEHVEEGFPLLFKGSSILQRRFRGSFFLPMRMRLNTMPTVKQIIIQYTKRRHATTRESAPYSLSPPEKRR